MSNKNNRKIRIAGIIFALALFVFVSGDFSPAYAWSEVQNATCSGTPSQANVGSPITWKVTLAGTYNHPITYVWTGDEGLSSNASTVTKTYATAGTKTASVKLTVADGSVTKTCNVVIKAVPTPTPTATPTPPPVCTPTPTPTHTPTPTPTYTPTPTPTSAPTPTPTATPTPVTTATPPQDTTISNFGGSCTVTLSGQTAFWGASATGGTGGYTYSWSGDEGLTGNSSNVTKTYTSTGMKNAMVHISTSNGESLNRSCSIRIDNGGIGGGGDNGGTSGGGPSSLIAYCVATPAGQNVTWTVFPTGGTGSYTYAWSGTDTLAGTSATISKAYPSIGSKSGSVVVTSGNQTVTANCSTNMQSSGGGSTGGTVATTTGGVYLSSIPATGISPTLKAILFLAGLLIWSAFLGSLYIMKKNEKAKINALMFAGSTSPKSSTVIPSMSAQISAVTSANAQVEAINESIEGYARTNGVLVAHDALDLIIAESGNDSSKAQSLMSNIVSIVKTNATEEGWIAVSQEKARVIMSRIA